MKHLKPYKNVIKEGDFVVLKTNKDLNEFEFSTDYDNFLQSAIGKVVGVHKEYGGYLPLDNGYIIVKFDGDNNYNYPQPFLIKNVKHFSSNKDELKQILSAEKYNL